MATSVTPVPLANFNEEFGSLIELSSNALGASIHSVSDEFFAEASNLLKPSPAISMKGQFGPNGALFDGWESRRHQHDHDWVIVKLGAPLADVVGVDIDTANFNGNESPASDVWGVRWDGPTEKLTAKSPEWRQLMPITPLGPSSPHLFRFTTPSGPITHVKLTMHPDGGIGRFRAYGHVILPEATPETLSAPLDLAYVLNGARAIAQSDQHFGKGANLILPGRGKDMGDGWETKRSRGRLGTGEGDWVVIKLGEKGWVEWLDLDTKHFCGNFPHSWAVYGIDSEELLPPATADWEPLLLPSPETKPAAHRHHFFRASKLSHPITHIRVNIYPDGGLKRVRAIGFRAAAKELVGTLESPETTEDRVEDGLEQVKEKEESIEGEKKGGSGKWWRLGSK
ncbi:Allantoicase [Meredithblackwellia eburnea MCA 4105]